ncbi:uncharacterized protein METZ01_LOCUS371669, partial [marine metagenome]
QPGGWKPAHRAANEIRYFHHRCLPRLGKHKADSYRGRRDAAFL